MRPAAVILAAGLGTRMKSSVPKVLHTIYGKPLIRYVLDAVTPLNPAHYIVVAGPGSDAVKNALDGRVAVAVQKEPKGTGDALKTAAGKLKGFGGTILVLCGDTPLISHSTLLQFIKTHKSKKEDLSVLSFIAGERHSYGRIVREGSRVTAIVEDRDADEEQKEIREVNGGVYAMEPHVLNLLKDIKINKAKGEYYLTDIVGLAVRMGHRVGAHILGDEMELMGINTRHDLHLAGRYLREKIISGWMGRGVTFLDTSCVSVHPEAKIGPDTVIYPNVHIEGKTVIGTGCVIYPNSRITDGAIGNYVTIKDSTLIEQSVVKDRAAIGPFAHLRPGSVIGPSARIGNFVEIKKSVIGSGAKASHLSYIGDAEVGQDVNIGAGTITCNYDGKEKHRTIIGEGSFIGSDTQLVAPVKIGKGAYVGAGSTITRDVPPGSLAVSRTKQTNIENWAARKKSRDRR